MSSNTCNYDIEKMIIEHMKTSNDKFVKFFGIQRKNEPFFAKNTLARFINDKDKCILDVDYECPPIPDLQKLTIAKIKEQYGDITRKYGLKRKSDMISKITNVLDYECEEKKFPLRKEKMESVLSVPIEKLQGKRIINARHLPEWENKYPSIIIDNGRQRINMMYLT